MVSKLFIPLTYILIVFCTIGCENHTIAPGDLRIELTSHTGCKYKKSASCYAPVPDSLSCIYYFYDSKEQLLLLQHINAGFNCCPGELSVTIQVNKNTITLSEHEEMPACNCNCLFDLDFEIKDLPAGAYRFVFIEPYIMDEEILDFEIDLKDTKEGSVCVTRHQYPWNMAQW